MVADISIELKSIKKDFRKGTNGATSLKALFTSIFKKSPEKAKQLRVQQVLKGIDVQIEKGEFVGIVGRNGSGKSTLLKILAGIYKPTSGSIAVRGKLVPFIELGVGFNPDLTGKENVYLNGAMLGFTRKEMAEMYDAIVDFSGLHEHMAKQLKNYSSGMQVRLAFSIAIRSKAEILLIDEVLAVGDSAFQNKCFEYFSKLKNDGRTVVFVSHDMSAIKYYCDRAIVLSGGKIAYSGDTSEAADRYLDLASIGSAPKKPVPKRNKRNQNTELLDSFIEVSKESISIKAQIKAKKPCKAIMAGFQILNENDTGMVGYNTSMLGIEPFDLKSHEKKTVSWKIANSLPSGRYSVRISFMSFDGSTTYGRFENISSGIAINKLASPFPIVPEVTVKLS